MHLISFRKCVKIFLFSLFDTVWKTLRLPRIFEIPFYTDTIFEIVDCNKFRFFSHKFKSFSGKTGDKFKVWIRCYPRHVGWQSRLRLSWLKKMNNLTLNGKGFNLKFSGKNVKTEISSKLGSCQNCIW